MKRRIINIAAAAALAVAGIGNAAAETFRLTIGAGHPADAAVWITTMRDFLAPEISQARRPRRPGTRSSGSTPTAVRSASSASAWKRSKAGWSMSPTCTSRSSRPS